MGMGMAINTAQLSVFLLCEAGMHELGSNVGEYNHHQLLDWRIRIRIQRMIR
jgi:hypothetical protein